MQISVSARINSPRFVHGLSVQRIDDDRMPLVDRARQTARRAVRHAR